MSAVAIDCMMVLSGNQPTLGCVVIVNEEGTVLLNECVKPTVVITDYRSPITKITKEDLELGKSLSVVQSLVSSLIKDNILVGYELEHYLCVLELSHPECDQRDLERFGPYRKIGFLADGHYLKELAKIFLNKIILDEESNSLTNVRIFMKLYKLATDWNSKVYGH